MSGAARLDIVHLVGHEPPDAPRALLLRTPATAESTDEPGHPARLDATLVALEKALVAAAPPELAAFLDDSAAAVARRARPELALLVDLAARLAADPVRSIRLTTDNAEGRRIAGILRLVAREAGVSFAVDDRRGPIGAVERVARRPYPSVRLLRGLGESVVDLARSRSRRASGTAAARPAAHVVFVAGRHASDHLLPVVEALGARGEPVTVLTTEPAVIGQIPPSATGRFVAPVWTSPGVVRRIRRHTETQVGEARAALNLDGPGASALVEVLVADLAVSYQRWSRVAKATGDVALTTPATAVVLFWSTIEGGAFVGTMGRRAAVTTAVEHGALLARAGRPVTDHFFVWGDQMAATARRLFGERPVVTTTGNPHEEQVLEAPDPAAPLPSTPTLLVAFGRPNMIIAERSFTAGLLLVRDAARALRGKVRFVVSVHPADKSGHWPSLAADPDSGLEILPPGRFYTELHRSAGVITMFSTAGSEAARVGRPVFVASPDHVVDRSGLAPAVVVDGAAYLAATPDELVAQVGQVVVDGDDPLAQARADHGEAFLHTDPEGRTSADLIADQLVALRSRP